MKAKTNIINNQQVKREEKSRKRRKRPNNRFLAVFLLIVLAVLLFGYFKEPLSRLFVDVVSARYSFLEEQMAADFLVMREEVTVAAPFGGKLELNCQEGERVAKGKIIGYLIGEEGTSLEKLEKKALISPAAGIVSLQTDGYEVICDPKQWRNMDMDKFAELEVRLDKKALGDAKDRRIIQGGQFIFKIIDNLAPTYLYMETEEPLGEPLKTGKVLELKLAGLDKSQVKATIVDANSVAKKSRILLRISSIPGLEDYRRIKGIIILDKYYGTVIPRESMVKKEGIEGIYTLKRGRTQWKEVTIEGMAHGMVAVTGLASDDWVITTPHLLKEGQRVFSFHNWFNWLPSIRT